MSSDRPALRVRTPGDLAALVPHLLGFVPAESLVAIALTGPRRRVGLTARADLADAPALLPQVVGALAGHQATGCALVVCTEQPSAAGHPFIQLVDDVAQALEARGIEVTETVLVRGGHWWSYRCAAACCPSGGTPVAVNGPLVTAVASERAYDGRVVLDSREALAATLAPCPPLGPAMARRLQTARGEDLAERLVLDGPGAAVPVELARWRAALDAWRARPGRAVDDVAALAVGLHLVQVRDEVASWGLAHGPAVLGLLGAVARSVVPPDDAPLLTVLGGIAYAEGDGALALLALQRALTTDPEYSLAVLLLSAVDAVLPPADVRAVLRQSSRSAPPARSRAGRSGRRTSRER